MLLKLYRHDSENQTMHYWEAWDTEDEVTIHYGVLGDQGETTTIPLNEFESPQSAIEREAAEAREHGFSEIPHESLYELILQYPVQGMGTAADLDMAFRIEEILNETLGWTGNGHCDGNDIGGGKLNIFAYVVNPQLALKPILEELEAAEFLDYVVIAYQDHSENFVVMWPENYSTAFSTI